MRRLFRRPRVLAALLLFAIIAAGYLFVPVGEPRISRTACSKIRPGMQWDDVDALLYKQLETSYGIRAGKDDEDIASWGDGEGNAIEVVFKDERVAQATFKPTKLSLFELAKRRLQRRIQALWP